jgi:acyl-CoA thioester hydrolase
MDVRYRDLDTWNHVNNAVYATYLEQARIDYLDSVRADGEVAATGHSTQVHMGADGSPAPLPEDWRAAIVAFEPALA